MSLRANKFRNHIRQTRESLSIYSFRGGIHPYRVSGRLIARDAGLSITVTRYFAYSRAHTRQGYILFISLRASLRDAHVFGEYFSRDTKVSEFADVENVPIAALMHVFMHGRAHVSTRCPSRPYFRGTRYSLVHLYV